MHSPQQRYTVLIHSTREAVATVLANIDGSLQATPFQSRFWLTRWYEGFLGYDGAEPLLVELRETATGVLAYLLPLISRPVGGLTQIEFADLGVTDYNLPVLGPAAPVEEAECRAAWDAVSAALPAADLCVFEKMPKMIGARKNPMMQAIGGDPIHLIGSYVSICGTYEEWLAKIGRHNRKEFGRFWRVFTRADGAHFVRARNAKEAAPILAFIEERQSERAHLLPAGEYQLDIPHFKAFYRDLVAGGASEDRIIVTALIAGDEIVAGLYAISDGTHYAMVRIAIAEGAWGNCSPGRLIIERSMHALHAEGYRWFDFTTGDYAYKRTFRTVHVPLHTMTLARSARGLPRAMLALTKAFVKRHPTLERLARRFVVGGGRTAIIAEPEPERLAS